jgi:hypothetical protein
MKMDHDCGNRRPNSADEDPQRHAAHRPGQKLFSNMCAPVRADRFNGRNEPLRRK